MKLKIYLLALVLLVSGLSITTSAEAQQNNNDTTVSPQKQQEEIVIREKGIPQKDLDIHIKGDEVWVNGKKLENGADSNIMVLRRQVPVFDDDNNNNAFSMGPHQGMQLFQNGPGNNYMFNNNNKALLGVVTEKPDSISGAKITDISEGTAAGKSDLQVGDIITKVNDDVIKNPQDLVTAIGKYQPGDEVNITYNRNGDTRETKIKLGKRDMMGMLNIAPNTDNWQRQFTMPMPMGPGNTYGFSYHYPGEDQGKPELGLSIQDTENGNGVKVLDVAPSSPAAIAGIKKDDIIKQFDAKDIHTVDEMAKMLHANKSNDDIQLKILRDGKTKDITVKLPKHLRTMNL